MSWFICDYLQSSKTAEAEANLIQEVAHFFLILKGWSWIDHFLGTLECCNWLPIWIEVSLCISVMVFLLLLLPTLFLLNLCWSLACCDLDYTIFPHTDCCYMHSNENFLLVSLNAKQSLTTLLGNQLYPQKYYSFFSFVELLSVIILGPDFGNMQPLMIFSQISVASCTLLKKGIIWYFLKCFFPEIKHMVIVNRNLWPILGLISPLFGRK